MDTFETIGETNHGPSGPVATGEPIETSEPVETIEVTDVVCGRGRGAKGRPGRATRTVVLLPQHSRAKRVAWWEREDLYWAFELFRTTALFEPHGVDVIELIEDGRGRIQRARVREPSFTTTHDTYLTASAAAAAIVGWLGSYHHATTTQLVCATGYSLTTTREVLRRLWQAGIVERASFGTGRRRINAPRLYHLRRGPQLRHYVAALDERRWLAVTGGVTLGPGPNHTRHNLLTGELALRLGETQPDLQAIFGEPLATPGLLLGVAGAGASNRGDLVVVRGDGLRIVVELVQSSRRAELAEKMGRWGRLLAGSSWHHHGVVVVFVAAGGSHNHQTITNLQWAHANDITAAGLGLVGAADDDPRVVRTRAQILVADWEEWFPLRYRVSTDFTALSSAMSTPGGWRRISLASPGPGGLPFNPSDPAAWGGPRAARHQAPGVPADLGAPFRRHQSAPSGPIPNLHGTSPVVVPTAH